MIIGNNVKLTNVNPLKFSSTDKVSDNKNIQLFNTKSAKPAENTPTIEKLRLLEALEQGLTDEVIRGMLEDFEYIFDFGVTDNNLIIYQRPGNDNLMTISVYDASFEKIGNKRMLKSYTFNRSLNAMSRQSTKNSGPLYLMENTPDGKFLFTQVKDCHNWDDSIINPNDPNNSFSEQMLFNTLEDFAEGTPSSEWQQSNGIKRTIWDYENKTFVEYFDNGEIKSKIQYKDHLWGKVLSTYTKVDNPQYKGEAHYSVERKDNVLTITNHKTSEEVKLDLDNLLKYFLDSEQKQHLCRELLNLPGECLMDLAKEIKEPFSVEGHVWTAGEYSIDSIAIQPNVDCRTIAHELGHAISYTYINGQHKFCDFEINSDEMKRFLEEGNKRFGASSNRSTEFYATKNVDEMFAECYTLLMTGYCKSKDCILKYFPKTLESVKEHLEHIRSLPQEVRCRR